MISDAESISKMAPGAIRRIAAEREARDRFHAELSAKPLPVAPQWISLEGRDVLRLGESRFVAVPCTGRKNAAKYMVLDLFDRSEPFAFLKAKEVFAWLAKAAATENDN
jgi:hypothetical protein